MLSNKIINELPMELVHLILEFHHCVSCLRSKSFHCNNCNLCNVDKRNHILCDICHKCFPEYVKIYMNTKYYSKFNFHQHCTYCNSLLYLKTPKETYCRNCNMRINDKPQKDDDFK